MPKQRNISKNATHVEVGEVTQVEVVSTNKSQNERIIRIKLAQYRFVQEGDKFAAPYSQKGTAATFSGSNDTEGENLGMSKYNDEGEIFDSNFVEGLNSGKINRILCMLNNHNFFFMYSDAR